MTSSDSFIRLVVRLRRKDEDAASEVFRRFVRRLVALACRQFDTRDHAGADPEGVVQSALGSFFARLCGNPLEFDGWEDLWGLLAVITLRKCSKKRRHLRAARRDVGRERPGSEAEDLEGLTLDRGPTPEEAAMLSDMVEHLLSSTEPGDRPIVEQILMGYTAEEVAACCDCSVRTVGRVRQRVKQRLLRQLAS
jgi:DNA-directed RNA polymerase specialized sigma24 family protein